MTRAFVSQPLVYTHGSDYRKGHNEFGMSPRLDVTHAIRCHQPKVSLMPKAQCNAVDTDEIAA